MKNFTIYIKIFTSLILLIGMTLPACSSKKMTADELKLYLLNPEHGAMKELDPGNYKIQVIYRPSDLLVAQELKSMNSIKEEELNKIKDNYNQFIYFILSISSNNSEILKNVSDQKAFENTVKELSFGMRDNVSLITSKHDTIQVADYIYPRMFGTSGATTMLFAFSKEKINNTNYIDFNLKGVGLTAENNSFRFDMSDIKHIPEVELTLK